MREEFLSSDRSDLLQRAARCWRGMEQFRKDRERCKRFTYGDQWGDSLPSSEGGVTEEEYLLSQGNMPLKNNLIRRLVRNVLGVFRNQWRVPQCVARDVKETTEVAVMQRLLEYNIERNRMEEMYARTMEEFLISGMAVHKKWYGHKAGHTDCWTDNVSPERFFIDNSSRDFRNWDVSLIGEVHELEAEYLFSAFSEDEEEYGLLRRHYASLGSECWESSRYDADRSVPVCRVIEVWTREYVPRYLCHDPLSGEYFRISVEDHASLVEAENKRRMKDASVSPLIRSRWEMAEEWHYHFLTPDGMVISSGKSPYRHGRHPYTVKAYPFIDGEIHSFVADIIDQQKFTNRLISMYDWILRASAKGVLLFPEDSLPAGVNISDIREEWSRFNGVILFHPKAGDPLPTQVNSNVSNNGITDLLSIQMKMMEDISGVNGALQGKLDSNSISGTLYDQQTRNSLTALADLLKCFNDFILSATEMDAANIRQFYTPQMISAILGSEESIADTPTFFDSSFDVSFRIGIDARERMESE